MPRPLDLAKVERAKALKRSGKSIEQIAKIVGVSKPTVSRYLARTDENLELELDRARDKQADEIVSMGWEILHVGYRKLLKQIQEQEIKPKELATILGITADKIMAFTGGKSNQSTHNNQVLIQICSNEDDGRNSTRQRVSGQNELDAIEISQQPCALPGNDLRPGSGQNILALPGSCDDLTELSRDEGDDSCIDVPEPE